MANTTTASASTMNIYGNIKSDIIRILVNDYGMTVENANKAISCSPLNALFKQDLEMAAHRSNDAWAKDVYNFWLGYLSRKKTTIRKRKNPRDI